MSPETALGKRDHVLLIGDGFLLTAGTMAVALALGFGLMGFGSTSSDPGVAIQLASTLLLFGGGIAGVVVTWLLHGRRIDGATVIGGLVGAPAGGACIPVIAGLSFLIGLPLKLVTDSEFAGPLATLGIVSVALVVLIVWLLADGVRDLAPERRTHVRLDLARIAAAAMLLLLAVVCVYLVFTQPGPEQGEAVIWAMAAGLTGAGVIAGADLANVLWARRKSSGSQAVGA
jgi:hypothetical protein